MTTSLSPSDPSVALENGGATAEPNPTDRRISGDLPTPVREVEPPRERPLWNIIERQQDAARIAELERKFDALQQAIVESSLATRHQRELESQTQAHTGTSGLRTLDDYEKAVTALPKFSEFDPEGRRYIATVAFMSGLNPEFEVHAWEDEDDYGRKKIIICPDYTAILRRASIQYMMIEDRRLSADEMKERGVSEADIDKGAIGVLVEIYDLTAAALAVQAHLQYKPFRGYGYFNPTYEKWDKQQKKKITKTSPVAKHRDPEWMAWKRAVRGAGKQCTKLGINMPMFRQIVGASMEDEDTYVFDQPSALIGTPPPALPSPESQEPAATADSKTTPDTPVIAGAETSTTDPEASQPNGNGHAPEQAWKDVIGTWTPEQWENYGIVLLKRGLKPDDVRHVLSGLPKDFGGTRAQHNAALMAAELARRQKTATADLPFACPICWNVWGTPFCQHTQAELDQFNTWLASLTTDDPAAEPDLKVPPVPPAPTTGLKMDGDSGSFLAGLVTLTKADQPELRAYALKDDGTHDMLPAITEKRPLKAWRTLFPNTTPSKLGAQSVTLYDADNEEDVILAIDWERTGEDKHAVITAVHFS